MKSPLRSTNAFECGTLTEANLMLELVCACISKLLFDLCSYKPKKIKHFQMFYSLSRKTLNTRENVWNVYCFVTNKMPDETAKDNCQTAACISHNLIQNNELAFSSTTNLQFYLFKY